MNSLLLSLKIMHFLKIIHGDIKPSNIMWSPIYNKNIFIDFGLSKIIQENVGEMTLTNFFGTFAFCSSEMKNLMGMNKVGFIDLYFNDYYCLRKVLES